jgi:hypothetical protein
LNIQTLIQALMQALIPTLIQAFNTNVVGFEANASFALWTA